MVSVYLAFRRSPVQTGGQSVLELFELHQVGTLLLDQRDAFVSTGGYLDLETGGAQHRLQVERLGPSSSMTAMRAVTKL
jgi:hypothetical protein